MRDLFYYEMRKSVEEIHAIEEPVQVGEYHITSQGQMLIDTLEYLVKLANISRKQGLLSLEEALVNMDETMEGARYIRQFGLLIVDGVDPEKVEEIALARYFTSRLHDYGALQYILIVFGFRAIQEYVPPVIIEDELVNILPEEITDEYRRIRDEKEEEERERASQSGESHPDMSKVERICSEDGSVNLQPGDESYDILKKVEQAFITLDGHGIQRALQDISNTDLEMAMKVLNCDARRNIFGNMSARLAVMVAEDMDFMEPIRLKDATEACKKIYNVIQKLIDVGEINC